MKRIFALGALLLLTLPAQASLPTAKDSPAGCGWRATVVDTHPGDDFVIDLVLTQMIGKCMYNPGPCGTKDDHLSTHVKKEDIQSYHAGQIVKIWVTDGKVSMDTAVCMQTPG